MQGIVKAYNPVTRDGIVVSEADMAEITLSEKALEGTIFRMLRPGQRINFDLDSNGQAKNLRLGSEVDMATPE